MRYLVTGGSGFIGSNTVDELVRRGHDVVVLDDLSTGRAENLANSRTRIKLIQDCVTNLSAVREACRGADCVIHLAARTSVPQSVQDPAETNKINVDGTLNVLLAARDAGVRRLVFSSSTAVYGDTPALPTREDMPPAPISPYGISKLAGELYGQVFHRAYGFEAVSLRYFNIFGPRQDPGSPYSGVLSLFITTMLENRRPTVFGDGEQSRDFTFVSDVVEANLVACQAPGAAGKAFNIGTGVRCTLNQTLRLLEKFAGHPAEANYAAPRPGDIRDSQADITLAQKALGYRPRIEFEEGLRLTWQWYKAERQARGQR